jgi:hypothetical protein
MNREANGTSVVTLIKGLTFYNNPDQNPNLIAGVTLLILTALVQEHKATLAEWDPHIAKGISGFTCSILTISHDGTSKQQNDFIAAAHRVRLQSLKEDFGHVPSVTKRATH